MKDIQFSFLADYYGSLLGEKALEVIRMYYDDDLSLAEIAEKLEITRQGVYDYIKKTNAALKDYEERLHLKERADKLRAFLCDNIALAESNTDTKVIAANLKAFLDAL